MQQIVNIEVYQTLTIFVVIMGGETTELITVIIKEKFTRINYALPRIKWYFSFFPLLLHTHNRSIKLHRPIIHMKQLWDWHNI